MDAPWLKVKCHLRQEFLVGGFPRNEWRFWLAAAARGQHCHASLHLQL